MSDPVSSFDLTLEQLDGYEFKVGFDKPWAEWHTDEPPPLGKDAGPKGIVLPEEMPAAIQALEDAIAREEAEQKAAVEEAKAKGQVPPRFEAVSLRQRAVPFIDMLRRCSAAGKEIVWGV